MDARNLLAGLRQRGVSVALEAGEMKLRGSAQVLTPKVLAAAKAHKPALRELLLLEAAAAPQVLEHSSTWGGREVLRPDLCEPLGLAALDEDPPEPCPHPRLVWTRDLGCWLDGDIIVSTVTTAARRNLYYAAQRARCTLDAAAECVGHAPPNPREIFELAEALVQAAQDEAAWRAAGGARQFPDELDAGVAFNESWADLHSAHVDETKPQVLADGVEAGVSYRAQNSQNTEVPKYL